jgi:hypothetical protein
MKSVLIGIVLFTIPLWALYQTIVGSLAVSLPMTIHHGRRRIFVLLGVGVYGGSRRLVEQSVFGITIATILFAAVVLLGLMGAAVRWAPSQRS